MKRIASRSPVCGRAAPRPATHPSSRAWKESVRSGGRSCLHASAACVGWRRRRSTTSQPWRAFRVSSRSGSTPSCMASPPNSSRLSFNAPMALTWARIAMIPLVVGIFYVPDAWFPAHWKNAAACWLFVLAAITDAFDGYIARRYGMTTPLGAFLDPVADKLMVSAALVVLLSLDRVDAFVALVIIGREIAVSALRE